MSGADRIDALIVFPEFPELGARLEDRFPTVRFHTRSTVAEAAELLPEVKILLVGLGLDASEVSEMRELEWIQCVISGTDHVLAALAGRKDVLVTNARGLHGPQVSEMALFQMLCLSRGARDLFANQGQHRWQAVDQIQLRGKTLVIVGLGVIGEHLAASAAALGMTVLAVTRTRREIEGVERVVDRSQLPDVAGGADYLVVLVPNEDADAPPLIGPEVFAAMKPTAFLVNLGRGGNLDEAALIEALETGQIAGAGLDVFSDEPLAPDSPIWKLPNVMITPHLAGRSDRYLDQLVPLVAENLGHFLADRPECLRNVVLSPPQAEVRKDAKEVSSS